MYGLAPRHIRRLCDNGLEGGFGYTPQEAGSLTLDQVFMLLTDRGNLRSKPGSRITKISSLGAKSTLTKNGELIAGRAADGTPIKAKIAGKSLARQLMEKKEQRLLEEAKAKEQQGKRRRRK